MKNRTILLVGIFAMLVLMPSVHADVIIIDHTCTNLSQIPADWLNQSKAMFNLSYGHTSHGSQIVTGMNVIKNPAGSFYWWDHDGTQGGLSLHDYTPSGDLGNPDRYTWESRTRAMLDNPGNDRNMVMWSWCGQADTTPENMQIYLDLMSGLEEDYPHVTFIYMTGHLTGSGEDGNLNQRNNQIRAHCIANNSVLFDFADVESYDPDGNYFLDKGAEDNCDYWIDSAKHNWADEWCDANPGSDLCISCSCAHSKPLNCNLKGRAFWWMMARLAGWDGVPENGVIYVPDNYAKIQWAVDNASEGNTIIVRDGTYTENVDVNKRLTIRSENGTGNCIVDAANPGDHVFAVTASYVNISGFTIVGATEDSVGVYIDSVGHCNISDNIVSNNNVGISLDNSSYNMVTNNIANMNERANILIYSSCDNQLTNNTASYGGITGIYMENSSYNTITNNTASENEVFGISLLYSCNNNLTGNIANMNELANIIMYSSCYNNQLTSNTASYGGTGIYIMENSCNNNLSSNNVNTNSDYGIYLDDSNNNIIYNNYFDNTNNAYDNGTNIWNTTTTSGPNIVGGPSIGGNYWSDYTGIDNNGNGFGDTAYNVPSGTNKDYLPLVPMCGDLDCNCIVNIMDVRLLLNHVNDPDGYPVNSWAGDVDGSGGINIVDVQRLLTHVFDPVGDPLRCS